jgi:polyphosphate glucokinase
MPTTDLHTADRAAKAPAGWSTLHRHHIGIDIGGTAIKYAVVDMAKGVPTTPVLQLPTPVPATPEAVAVALGAVVQQLSSRPEAPDPQASIGVALPAIVRHGVARSAANIDRGWLGLDVQRFLTERLGRAVHVLNDADAAGLAEIHYGAGRGEAGRPVAGTVLVITLGTGIGTALFVDGKLVPNMELGHLELAGVDVDTWASAVAREREQLDWAAYAQRLQRYFSHLEFLFSPDLFIVGGGISARHEDFLPLLDLETPIVPAGLRNSAGIIGAARHAYLAAPPLEQPLA